MQHRVILPADWRDPAKVLAAFADEPFAVGLLSGGAGADARWSYLARDPSATLLLSPDDASDPFEALRGLVGPEISAVDSPPFQGGVIGLATYELGARAEPVTLGRKPGWPDLVCGLYDAVLAFDHREKTVVAIGRATGSDAAQAAAERALSWLSAAGAPPPQGPLAEVFDSIDGDDYEAAVEAVITAIVDGDLFQANIARLWRGRLSNGVQPFDLAHRLVQVSPAPFAAYFRLTDLAVVSNSPERFLRLVPTAQGLMAQTRPIKGTAARSADPRTDAALARNLQGSAKDRAENLMIVDLMRNDLARVCTPGGIEVAELFKVETFANVHHLVSTVTGRLQSGKRAPDLLRAAFPPGSVTGAPKVQAMKTIAGLEPPRGPYCGSIFWLGFDGAFDSSVLIRTVVCEADEGGWSIEARAGAGIVADSRPEAERLETEAKIDAIRGALR